MAINYAGENDSLAKHKNNVYFLLFGGLHVWRGHIHMPMLRAIQIERIDEK